MGPNKKAAQTVLEKGRHSEVELMKSMQKKVNVGDVVDNNIFGSAEKARNLINNDKEELKISNSGQSATFSDNGYIRLDDLSVDCVSEKVKGVVIAPETLNNLLKAAKASDVPVSSGPLTFTGLCIAHLLNEGFSISAGGKELSENLSYEYRRKENYSSSISQVRNFFNQI